MGGEMTDGKGNGHADSERPNTTQSASSEGSDQAPNGTDEVVTAAAAVGVVAVGAALFEVALLPGIALGVVAMLAPKYVPRVGPALSPMFRSTVRGIYKFGQKTNEMVAEAKEQVQDIVAEVKAEDDVKADEEAKAATDAPKPAAQPQAAATP
jgi:hypothetical protein